MRPFAPMLLVFSLLSACRRQPGARTRALRCALRQRQVTAQPRLSYWITLLQSAGLLDQSRTPTLLVPNWLASPPAARLARLLTAWRDAPTNRSARRRRTRLLEQLAAVPRFDVNALNPAAHRELRSLQMLQVCQHGALTDMARTALVAPDAPDSAAPPAPWQLRDDLLCVPFPPDWSTLWELEAWLTPDAPGRYPLTDAALVRAAGHMPLADVIPILERGLACALPAEWHVRLANQPAARLLPGALLEIEGPDRWDSLQRSRSLRRELREGYSLSRRHLWIAPERVARLAARLHRHGLIAARDLPPAPPAHDDPPALACLPASDRAFLLALVQSAEHIAAFPSPPSGLAEHLAAELPAPLRAAAIRQAESICQRLSPPRPIHPEPDDPPLPAPDLVAALRDCMEREEALDILYHAPAHPTAELRRITPLRLEARGVRLYLIAYCHARRANRTFRLDRLALPGPYGSTPA